MLRFFRFLFKLCTVFFIALGGPAGLFWRLEPTGCANVFANTNSLKKSERFRNGERIKWNDQTKIEFLEFLKERFVRKMRETDPDAQWSPEQWYKVSRNDFIEAGGAGFIYKYGNSASSLITALIAPPPGGWRQELFYTRGEDVSSEQVFRGGKRVLWDDQATIDFMEFLKQKFLRKMRETDPNIEWKPEHWYQVRKVDIRQAGGVGLLFKYGNSASALIMALTPSPQAGWNQKRFRARKSCKTTLRNWNSDSTESSPAEEVDPSPQRSFAP